MLHPYRVTDHRCDDTDRRFIAHKANGASGSATLDGVVPELRLTDRARGGKHVQGPGKSGHAFADGKTRKENKMLQDARVKSRGFRFD